jgi:hypothetical protein
VRGFIVRGLLIVVAGCGASSQQEVAAVIHASDAGSGAYASDLAAAGMEGSDVMLVDVIPAEPPRMTDIRVDGDTAVASYSSGDRTRLRKVDGHWLIDSF